MQEQTWELRVTVGLSTEHRSPLCLQDRNYNGHCPQIQPSILYMATVSRVWSDARVSHGPRRSKAKFGGGSIAWSCCSQVHNELQHCLCWRNGNFGFQALECGALSDIHQGFCSACHGVRYEVCSAVSCPLTDHTFLPSQRPLPVLPSGKQRYSTTVVVPPLDRTPKDGEPFMMDLPTAVPVNWSKGDKPSPFADMFWKKQTALGQWADGGRIPPETCLMMKNLESLELQLSVSGHPRPIGIVDRHDHSVALWQRTYRILPCQSLSRFGLQSEV